MEDASAHQQMCQGIFYEHIEVNKSIKTIYKCYYWLREILCPCVIRNVHFPGKVFRHTFRKHKKLL